MKNNSIYNNFPSQKLSRKQKTKDWAETCGESIIGFSTVGQTSTKDLINYDLYNGILNPEDFVHVTNPYGNEYDLPVDLQHYDIISSKINLLLGEEIKRPFNFRVKAVNENSISRKQEALRQQLLTNFEGQIQQEMYLMGLSSDNPEQPPVPENYVIENFNLNYKLQEEKLAQEILNYLVKELNIKEVFNTGFKDALIAGREVYWTGIVNGQPVLKRINPVHFDFDKSSNVDYIHQSQWAKYEMYMTPGEIIDEYGEYLNDEQLEYVESGGRIGSRKSGFGSQNEIMVYRNEGPIFMGTENSGYRHDDHGMLVTHMEWRSLRKIGFLSFVNEEGEVEEVIVSEEYKEDKKDPNFVSIEWKWVPEIWEITNIDNEYFINARPKINQFRSQDNPYEASLSYTGLVYDDTNSQPVSILDRMKTYQYEFNITMYRISLELSKSRGKKVIYDLAQIPTGGEYDIDMERWLYYGDVLGIIFIDSNQENDKGQRSGFNQWKEIDMTLSQSLGQMLEYLREIDYRCSRVTGISEQREGQIGANELVTNAQRAVVQSSHITEGYFNKHNNVKGIVLTKLLETAKLAYREGKKLQYITDDMMVNLINVNPETISLSDFGIFVTNSGKEEEFLNIAKQLANQGISSGAFTMADALDLLSSENPSEIKNKVRVLEEKRMQQQQQQQEQAMQQQQEAMQAEQQAEQQKLELEMLKLQLEDTLNQRDNDTKLAIAQLQQMGGQQEGLDQPDYAGLNLERQKLAKDMLVKNKELELKNKEMTLKDKLEKLKLELQEKMHKKDLVVKNKEIAAKKAQASRSKAIAGKE